jgi:hypothetical protein
MKVYLYTAALLRFTHNISDLSFSFIYNERFGANFIFYYIINQPNHNKRMNA